MKATIAVAAIATSLALFGGIFALAGPASGAMHTGTAGGNASDTMTSGMMGDTMMPWLDGSHQFGMISSIQNDETGQPGWIVAGHWMMTNDTTSNGTTIASTNGTDFYAAFYMTMLDGSAQHTHEIYNFTQDGNGTTDGTGNMTTMTGTSTVTMREGPIHDVGTEITISQGNVLAITLDQAAVENHFGNTPIYGMVISPEIVRHAMNETTTSTIIEMDRSGHYKPHGNETGTASADEMWK